MVRVLSKISFFVSDSATTFKDFIRGIYLKSTVLIGLLISIYHSTIQLPIKVYHDVLWTLGIDII